MITARTNRFLDFSSQSRMLVTVLAVTSVVHLGAAARVRAADCNNNGTEDAIDIAAETSLDCNNDGIPDECQSVVVDEDFDSYSPDDDPANWFSTDTETSTDELTTSFGFRVRQVGSDLTLGTNYPHPNIHSHYVEPGATNISSMTYTGRMRISSSDCGIGVTFLSQFSDQPTSTYEYVRIRRANYAPSAQTFHLAPPNFDNFVGVKDSGVNPSVNTWYRFRVVVDTGGSQLHVQANIWEDGQPEPAGFQIDAIDSSGQHPTSGTIGVWSMGTGGKFWDDLEVVLPSNQVPCDDGDPCTTCDSTDGGPCEGIPVDCSHLDSDCGTGVCNANTGDCEVVPANEGGACNDSDACTTDDVCLAGFCTGSPIDCSQLDDTCNTGACNPSTGSCEAIAINEGGGCDDLNACTLNDECVGGVCTGDSVDCSHLDDGCTIGVCNESNGECETDSVEDGGSCDDLNPCTEGDTCTDGVCDGTPLDCSHLSSSCLPGVCNPGTGLCEGPPQTDCNMNGISDDCELLSSPSYAKLTAPDGGANDQLGIGVDIEGTTTVIGSHFASAPGVSDCGAVYVFENAGLPGEHVTKLTSNDAATNDYFGYSVSLSGDTLVVGANKDDDDGTDSGSVYVFELSNGVWQQVAKLTADDAAGEDVFGTSVALDGNTIVIGAHGDDSGGSMSGAVYVFENINGTWTQIDKLTADDASAGDLFGRSLALDGNTAVIGAYRSKETGVGETGAAYVFREIGGVWQQIAKLTSNDAADGDGLGLDVAIEGDTIVVGAYQDHEGAADSGAAFVFREIGGTWQQIAKLTSDNPVENANLGRSVAVNGNRIVVGAYRDNGNGTESGIVYSWREDGDIWSGPVVHLPADTVANDRFGVSAEISGNKAIVGAYLADDNGSRSGSAFLVTFAAEDCNSNGILDECDIASGVVTDCNLNGIPDICEPFGENSQDCSHLDDVCVSGVCNLEAGTCEIAPANEGGLCDDGDPCTDDTCVAGVCTGAAVDCSYYDEGCIDAVCNPNTGLCELPPYDDCNLDAVPDACHDSRTYYSDKFSGPDTTTEHQFGAGISIDEDVAIIGADGDNSSSAFIYRLIDGIWQYESTLSPNDNPVSIQFGHDVDIDGDTAIVGAFGDDVNGTDSGSAYVFRKTSGVWQQVAKLIPSDGATGDAFGYSVSISGSTIAVGAYLDGGNDNGSTYIFKEIAGIWQPVTKLIPTSSSSRSFGESVALNGDTLFIGSPGHRDGLSPVGRVFVYHENDGSWERIATLAPSESFTINHFGTSVSIDGDTIAVGCPDNYNVPFSSGLGYIFQEIDGTWQQIAKLAPNPPQYRAYMGRQVSISGDLAVFGATDDNANGNKSGAIYVSHRVDGTWQPLTKIKPQDLSANDKFGNAVAVFGNSILAGAYFDDDNGTSSGSVYAFTFPGPDCNNNDVLDECEITNGAVADCNLNGIPDGCEPFGENSQDCSLLDDICVKGICNLEAGTCETTPINGGGACDDNNACTLDDVCVDGACLGSMIDCSDLDIACVPATCDPNTGSCEVPEVSDCNSNGSPDACELIPTRDKLDNSATLDLDSFLTYNTFGKSVALHGDIAVVGNPEASTYYFFAEIPERDVYVWRHGRAHIFERVDGVWDNTRNFRGGPHPDSSYPPAVEGQHYGASVAVSNNTVVIGAPRFDSDGPDDSGAAYVLSRAANGYWSSGPKLKASDAATGDGFGSSVAISGSTIVVGRPADNANGENSGSAYVFQQVSGAWQQTAKLTADDIAAGDNFGAQVSVSGSTIIVGTASGAESAYIFKDIGGAWQQVAKLTADDAMNGDHFGESVSISGNMALVGARGDDLDETDAGSAYVFMEIGGVWQQIAKLVAEDGAEHDSFGSSVSISGSTAVIGAPDANNPLNGGATYVFREFCGAWQQVEKLVNTEQVGYENFGATCAVDGGTAVVGTFLPTQFGQVDEIEHPGDVYVFDLPQGDLNNNGIPDECDDQQPTVTVPIVASPSASECPGTAVTLDAGSGYESYLWEPGGETTQTIQVSSPGTYRVMASGGAGSCFASNAISVAFSGDQPGSAAALVSSKLTNSIVAIDTQSGKVLFDFAPSGKDGLSDPNGITVDDAGHVYVSSVNTSSVKKYAAFTGELIREYTGSLTAPVGVLVADANTLLVSNWSDDSVHKFDIVTGQALGQLVASGAGGLDGPADMLITPSGELLVSSQKGDQVLAYDAASGAFSHVAAQGGGLLDPAGLRLDSQGNLLVASFNSDQVLRFNPETGAFIDVFIGDNPGSPGTDESGGLDGPEGVEWGANGNLLVNNRYGSNVLEYDGTTGAFLRVLGAEGLSQPTYLTMTTLDPDCNADRIPDYCASDTGLAGMDCNFNGIGDQCDDASHGDFDANGVLDIIDFGYLADCQAGPDVAPSPASGSCANMCLQAFDADEDGDIDLQDFASFTLLP